MTVSGVPSCAMPGEGRRAAAYRIGRVTVPLGLGLMAFATPPGSAGWGTVVFPLGLPLLVLAALAWAVRRGPALLLGRLRLPGATIGFLLLATSVVPAFWAPAPIESAGRAFVNVVGYGLFLAALDARRQRDYADASDRFRSGLVVMAVLTAAQYLLVVAVGVSTRGLEVLSDRVVGGRTSLTWGASNTIAAILVPGLLLTLERRVDRSGARWARLLAMARAALLLLAILATFSRGALMSLVAGLVWLSLISGSGRMRRTLALALAGGAVTLLVSMLVGNRALRESVEESAPGLTSRFQTYESVGAASNERLQIFDETLSRALERPLLGHGYYSAIYVSTYSGHNWLLTTLLERGAVGVILSLPIGVSLLAAMFGRRRPRRRRERPDAEDAENAALVAMAVHLMVEDTNFLYPHIVLSWVLFGLVLGRQRRRVVDAAAAGWPTRRAFDPTGGFASALQAPDRAVGVPLNGESGAAVGAPAQ